MDHEQWERRLMQMAKNDPWYQQLLRSCEEAEPEYLRIRQNLSEEDQEKLDHYISLCEELGHRMTWLACEARNNEEKRDG